MLLRPLFLRLSMCLRLMSYAPARAERPFPSSGGIIACSPRLFGRFCNTFLPVRRFCANCHAAVTSACPPCATMKEKQYEEHRHGHSIRTGRPPRAAGQHAHEQRSRRLDPSVRRALPRADVLLPLRHDGGHDQV